MVEATEPANESNEGTGGSTRTPGAEASAPPSQIDALKARVAELEKRNLRLIADARNMQQRAMREKDEALRFAEGEFARELLVVLDDLERTLESAKDGAEVAAIADGARITYEHFIKTLRKHHIQPIEATGKPFDPHLHEALMQQPSDTAPAGTILQEVARGYSMHGRVLRHSRVVVSSGAPAPGSTPPDVSAPPAERI
jgi:molecular chaperone GrpE